MPCGRGSLISGAPLTEKAGSVQLFCVWKRLGHVSSELPLGVDSAQDRVIAVTVFQCFQWILSVFSGSSPTDLS